MKRLSRKAPGAVALAILSIYAVMGISASADNWTLLDKALAVALVISALSFAGMMTAK